MSLPNYEHIDHYHHEESAHENGMGYELPFHLHIQQPRGEKSKDTGKPRRTKQMVPHMMPSLKRTQMISHYHNEISDDIILEEDVEEEDIYEEMNEDEDAEYETGLVGDPRRVTYRPSDIIHRSLIPTAQCISCHRGYTEKYRLFNWPRDDQMRQKWCELLGIDYDNVQSSLNGSIICAAHFSPNDFLCSPDLAQIQWSSHATPRLRSEYNGSYPWEKQIAQTIRSKREEFSVKFRASKYNVASAKLRHPVAIISSVSRPDVQYEFSWNRTSSLDGTKFYSCLHCRKANRFAVRGKDNVRTIHLNGDKLMSGDPLSGHHHACTPIGVYRRHGGMERRERMEYREDQREIQKKHHELLASDLNVQEKNGMNGGERIVYVDNSQAFASGSGAVVEVETEEGLEWTEDDGSTVAIHTVDGHHSNIDDLLLDGSSTDHNWIEYSKMDNMQVWKGEGRDEVLHRRETRSVRDRITKKYGTRHNVYGIVSLACPICGHRLPSTMRLIGHLEEHERNAGDCHVCGGRIDPALPLSIRRQGVCRLCKFQHHQ